MQRWRFLVIRDPEVKETVGALYKRAWDEQVAPRYRAGEQRREWTEAGSPLGCITTDRLKFSETILSLND